MIKMDCENDTWNEKKMEIERKKDKEKEREEREKEDIKRYR